MAHTPVPPPPPPSGGQAYPPHAPQPAAPRRSRGRIILWVVIGLVVVIAGCSTLLFVGGSRLVGAARAPVDTANEFLDAVRVRGQDADRHVCPGSFDLAEGLAASEGQHLTGVNISNNRVATVSGTVTLSGGEVSPLTVELHRIDDGWCVAATRFETAPN